MADMLEFATMKARIEACLVFEATVVKSGVRQEALRGLHYLFLSGEDMARSDFKAMPGKSARGATDVLGALPKRGLLESDSPQGKVHFAPAAACAALLVSAALAGGRGGLGGFVASTQGEYGARRRG
jgi:hypothetical protein